jgi:hypothetical protein
VGRNISGVYQEQITAKVRTVASVDVDTRGRIRIPPTGPLRITGPFRSPLISGPDGARGGLLFQDSRLSLPATLPAGTAPEARLPFNPRFMLALIAAEDVVIRNPNLLLEVRGVLPVGGSLAEPVVRGTLVVERGSTLRFPGAPPFRLTGDLTVNYAPGGDGVDLSPVRLDLIATGVTRGTNPATGRAQRYEITLNIRGGLTSEPLQLGGTDEELGIPETLRPRLGGAGLTIEATSSPPLSQTQILALLGRQSAVEGILAGRSNIDDVFRQEFEQVLGSSIVPGLLAPTEFRVAEALGLEEFGLEFAFNEPVRVRLGKRLFDRFFATYSQVLSGNERHYGLEVYYQLTDRLRIGYLFEEPEQTRRVLLEGSLRF